MEQSMLRQLPVYAHRDEIITALRTCQVIVVAGVTGSGKSTCLPLICQEAGYGEKLRIAVTQPRRIAAISLASYVAAQMEAPQRGSIGYQIRYRRSLEKNTRIVYMTDGVLLASLAGDPLLSQYDAIIIDEAHERSLTIDFLLGYLRTLLPRRPELRLIIASATLDTRLFSRAFGHAPVIAVKGRRFSVDIRYKPVIELWKGFSITSFIEGALVAVREIVASGATGDLLLFMPTVDDVMETVVRLRRDAGGRGCTVLPLHSRLSLQHQKAVFEPVQGRKIVVATNIAETSLTVPAIRFVIDTGLARVLRYEPNVSITRMPVEKISRASADQRSGRCGRVSNGVCIRLFSEQDYASRPRFTLPEIKRSGLAGLVLRMLSLRLGEPSRFPFLQRPPFGAIAEGYRMLQDIGALDKRRQLTSAGRAMARFPLDPPVACMLIKAKALGVLHDVMVVAAALSVQDPLCRADGEHHAVPADLRHPESDFMVFLKVWQRLEPLRREKRHISFGALTAFCDRYQLQPSRIREWMDAFDHLRRTGDAVPGFSLNDEKRIAADTRHYDFLHQCLLSGLIHGIAVHREHHTYEGIGAPEIRAATGSVAARKPLPWVLFHEIVETDRGVYGARAASIDPKWIEKLFKNSCSYFHEDPQYDPNSGTVTIRQEVRFRSLTLIKNRLVDCSAVDRNRAVETFCRQALTDELIGDRYRFIRHNRDIRRMIAGAEQKLRTCLYAGDGVLTAVYEELAPVATRKELDAMIKKRGNDAFLMLPKERLLVESLPPDMDEYADEIVVASYRLPVVWVHQEGSGEDGATVTVPERLFEALPWHYWEWQLPVLRKLREAMVVSRLAARFIEKGIDPADAVDAFAAALTVPTDSYYRAATKFLDAVFGIPRDLAEDHFRSLPVHCWLRVKVVNEKGVVVNSLRPPFFAGQRFRPFGDRLAAVLAPIADGIERPPPFRWEGTAFLQPRECRAVHQKVPCVVYPALSCGDRGVGVKIFPSENRALHSHAAALHCLLKEHLAEKMAWEIETITLSQALVTKSGVPEPVVYTAIVEVVERYIGQLPPVVPISGTAFEALLAEAEQRIAGSAAMITGLFDRVLGDLERCRLLNEKRKHRYAASRCIPLHRELDAALDGYRDALFSHGYSVEFLLQLPQYLAGFPRRSSAAFLDTANYRKVMQEVHESERIVEAARNSTDYTVGRKREKLRIMVQEYIMYQFGGETKKNGAQLTAAALAGKRSDLSQAILPDDGMSPVVD